MPFPDLFIQKFRKAGERGRNEDCQITNRKYGDSVWHQRAGTRV